MKRYFWLVLIGLAAAGCDRGAAVAGEVKDIDTQNVVPGAAVGFAQVQGGKFTIRKEFHDVTDNSGRYSLATEFGPFPTGFILFSHEDYIPDTVDFYGAEEGQTARVNIFLVRSGPPDTSAASSAR